MDTQNTIDQEITASNNSQTEPTPKPSKKNGSSQLTKDSLEFLRIKEAVLESDEIDNTEKIARLKKLIAEGNYDVDLDALSEKITQELI